MEVEGLVLFIVITFPEVPLTVKVVTVCVVPAVNSKEWAALPLSLKSLKVLLPWITIDAVLDPLANQTLLNVRPAPVKVIVLLDESLSFTVEVSAFQVNPVVVDTWKLVPENSPVTSRVPDPNNIDLVLEVLEEKYKQVKLKSFKSKVP